MSRIVTTCAVALSAMGGVAGGTFPDAADVVLSGITNPYSLCLGDLNNDGKPDLAVSSWAQTKDGKSDPAQSCVYLFHQKEGGFAQPADKVLPVKSPWGIAIGDFDDDDRNDLAVVGLSRHLHLFLGEDGLDADHADANINQSSHWGHRYVVALRLSAGGKRDFLCGPVWRKWMGGESFRPGYCYGPEINDNGASQVADLNGDGHPDLVFRADLKAPNGLRLYYGPFPYQNVRPAELSELVSLGVGLPFNDSAIGDLNGDGRLDLVASVNHKDPSQRRVVLYLQNAPMGFEDGAEPSHTIAGVSGGLAVADFDGDGRDDLLVCNAEQSRVYLFAHRG